MASPWALDRGCRLWRATRDALRPLAAPPAGADACVDLQRGPEGAWVASERRGLYLFDPADGRLLRHYPMRELHAGPDTISALLRLSDGRVLVGFADGTISELGADASPPRPLLLDRTLQSAIVALNEDSPGSLWIGTYTSGLYRVRPLSAAIRRDRSDAADPAEWPGRSLRAIRRDGGPMLVGTDIGLMQRSADGARWQAVPAFAGHSVRAIRSAPGGGWWIGT